MCFIYVLYVWYILMVIHKICVYLNKNFHPIIYTYCTSYRPSQLNPPINLHKFHNNLFRWTFYVVQTFLYIKHLFSPRLFSFHLQNNYKSSLVFVSLLCNLNLQNFFIFHFHIFKGKPYLIFSILVSCSFLLSLHFTPSTVSINEQPSLYIYTKLFLLKWFYEIKYFIFIKPFWSFTLDSFSYFMLFLLKPKMPIPKDVGF